MTSFSFSAAASDVPIPTLREGDPRRQKVGAGKPGHRGAYVLYWAQASRRPTSNHALSVAIAEANRRKLPVLVYESIRVDYPYASERFHAFVLEGAKDAHEGYRARGVHHVFFLPRSRDEQRGMVRKVAAGADLLVTDAHPTFIFPEQLARVARAVPCETWAIDDVGVVPLATFPKEEFAARTLRPKLVHALPDWLRPLEEPRCERTRLSVDLPFAPLDLASLDVERALSGLPIDREVGRVEALRGGPVAAKKRLDHFVRRKLSVYGPDHNHPDEDATSGLSPYLHFGMISAREAALAVAGSSALPEAKDAFLEQLLVRRELSFNFCARNPRHRTLGALPAWCHATLDAHRGDPRRWVYDRAALEEARTHDEVWNAAQRELRQTGIIHNYLRMLWGKCVLDWKRTPEEALDDLLHLNDRWALDGRDPNTYTGILWCFGKHDRPWGERPIHGTLRTMTTPQALKKLRMSEYMARWGKGTGRLAF